MLKFLSYPRAVLATIFVLAVTAAYSFFGIVISFLLGKKSRPFQDWVVLTWARILLWSFSIKVTVKGAENLSPDGVLFVFNHTSLFDIPIFHGAITKSTRFGAKIELYKIPVFGAAMKKFGALPIARAERDKVLKLYQDSIARVHKGESFILAGEGGRHSGAGVGDKFKSGPFIFAISGQFAIQPVVIKGASEILPSSRWVPAWGRWHNPVTLTVLPAVPTHGLTLDEREDFKATIHQMMTKAYAQS